MATKNTNSEVRYINIDVTVTMSDKTSSWSADFRAQQCVNFTIPEGMYKEGIVGDLVDASVRVLPAKYEVARLEYEVLKAKKEAEKESEDSDS